MNGKWDKILQTVRNPIPFFALVILGCFVLLGMAMKIEWPWVVGVLLAVIVGVTGLVGYITIRYPQHFYEELKDIRSLKQFITTKAFRDTVGDIVEELLKQKKD